MFEFLEHIQIQIPKKKSIIISKMTDDNTINLNFDEDTAQRRAALRMLPYVQDQESNEEKMILSKFKSSSRVSISSDLTCKLRSSKSQKWNSIGYCICRTNRGLKFPGKYYWEFEYLGTESNAGHCRIGISTTTARIEAPVGYDINGYCLRDKGNAFHCAKKFDGPSFKAGDVIGFGFTISEEEDKSSLCCWINGENPTLLFENIKTGVEWFPSISPYRDAQIRAQFDEPFKHFPGDEWKPAAKHPIMPSTEKYTVDTLISIMKSGKIADMNEEIVLAMNAVMAPPQEVES